jgi:hypothetical protein
MVADQFGKDCSNRQDKADEVWDVDNELSSWMSFLHPWHKLCFYGWVSLYHFSFIRILYVLMLSCCKNNKYVIILHNPHIRHIMFYNRSSCFLHFQCFRLTDSPR